MRRSLARDAFRTLPGLAIWLAIGFTVGSGSSHADASAPAAPPRGALIARLQLSSGSTTSLAGEFTQKSRIKLFKQELRARGRLYYERPSRIRWEYLAPDPSTLVV